jgi:hypothetical protein
MANQQRRHDFRRHRHVVGRHLFAGFGRLGAKYRQNLRRCCGPIPFQRRLRHQWRERPDPATGSYGVYIAGAVGSVTNLGTITGSSYAVDLTFSSAANQVVVGPGAVFNGIVSGGNGTLELAAGSGAAGTLSGTIGGTSGSFRNFSQLVIDPGAVWSLSGALQITTAARLRSRRTQLRRHKSISPAAAS